MYQYNDPHSYRNYTPVAFDRPRAYFTLSEGQEAGCSSLDMFGDLFTGNCSKKIREKAFGREILETGKTAVERFEKGESPLLGDKNGNSPTDTTTAYYKLNLFGKEIKIPKNITYAVIIIVMFIILIWALRSR